MAGKDLVVADGSVAFIPDRYDTARIARRGENAYGNSKSDWLLTMA